MGTLILSVETGNASAGSRKWTVIACPSSRRPTLILIIPGMIGVVTGHFEDKTIVACCRSEAPTAPTRETDRPWGKEKRQPWIWTDFNDQNLERLRSLASIATTEAERKILLGLLAEERLRFIELPEGQNGSA
jgi:hypothetical protein